MRKILLGLAAISTAITLSACNDSASSSSDEDRDDQIEQQDGTADEACDDDEDKEEEDAGACVLDPDDLEGADGDSDD